MTRFLIAAFLILPACAGVETTKQQPLDFEYCERIARETFEAGKLRYDLCPGYMPDGQPIELF